jgi:hypothetical protein
MLGFGISGLMSPLTIVPPYKELELCLDAWGKKFNPDDVQDVVSALFNAAYAVGGIVGPVFGSYMTSFTNFRTTADINAFIMIGLGTIQLILVYIPS